jgi:hypothetical protein
MFVVLWSVERCDEKGREREKTNVVKCKEEEV